MLIEFIDSKMDAACCGMPQEDCGVMCGRGAGSLQAVWFLRDETNWRILQSGSDFALAMSLKPFLSKEIKNAGEKTASSLSFGVEKWRGKTMLGAAHGME
jgi:hypothetical protein